MIEFGAVERFAVMPWRLGCQVVFAVAVCAACWRPAEADGPDYAVVDRELRVELIDRHPSASFVGVRVDAAGRVFVGGRESVFVYEPDGRGGYGPRQELYRFPAESWVFDILIRGHDLYVVTASALYVLPEAVVKRQGVRAERLVWGQPRGHLQLGFFGAAWGPEGDLYFSMGDPLQHYGDFDRADHWGHWTFFSRRAGQREPGGDSAGTANGWVRTEYTGVGGVFRCRPDGSRLQVVAAGIFRPCGLAFDRHWNLFTDDNDREAMPFQYVPARLLHVTPRAYFGWPRGWMVSKTPERADLLETMFAGLGREAPVGLAYYEEPLLPERYRGQLLMARWAQRLVTRFSLRPRGASFRGEQQPLLVGRRLARPVGLAVGLDGRLFVTILHMAHLEGSPTAPSDLVMITTADDAADRPLDGYEATAASAERLWSELSRPSWHRRYRAHVELLRRGGPLLVGAVRRLAAASGDGPAVEHLVWLAAASGTEPAARELARLARQSRRATVRLQAVRALAEFFAPGVPPDVFLHALADPDPQVQHAAVLALYRLPRPVPELVVRGPARSRDSYLRQAATLLLARRASVDELAKLCAAGDMATRLAGVLAVGFRLTLPPFTGPLPAGVPLQPFPEAACVIQFADAKVDLRRLGRLGMFTVAEHWAAGPHTAEQERLFALLLKMLGDRDERVRLQAAHFLLLLNDRRSEELVEKVVRASEERRLAAVPVSEIKTITKVWAVGPFPDAADWLEQAHGPEQGAIDLSASYAVGSRNLRWRQVAGRYLDFRRLFGPMDRASAYAYFRLQSPRRQRILLFVGSNDGVKVWQNRRPVWSNDVERRALAFQDPVLLDLQPGSNDVLVRVHNVSGDSGLYLSYKSLGPVVATVPEKLDMATLAERLRAGSGAASGGSSLGPEFLKVDWAKAVGEGDPERGRKLFGPDALACAKCHAIRPDQEVTGGPSLAEAGKRFTLPYLVESILLPNRNVAPVFRSTLIATKDGRVVSGLVVSETAERLELLLSDTTRQSILKREIESRKLQDQSPMPQDVVKTPDELRDLLAYLLGGGVQGKLAAGSGRLRFKPAAKPGYFDFDTGLLSGQLRLDGKRQEIARLVHVPTGVEVTYGGGHVGLLSHYRIFSAGRRFGHAARNWPCTARLLPDGSVEARFPPGDDHPLEMTLLYRWSAPETLDLETVVRPQQAMPGFEVFLSSYFADGFDAAVYLRPSRLAGSVPPQFVPADWSPLIDGNYLMFPRDGKVVPMIFDGRWERPPNPVQWCITRWLAAPLALRRHGQAGVTAVLMAPPQDCFAVSTPYNKTPPDRVAGHRSLYLSLFGRDVAAGRTVRARTRLIVAADLADKEIVRRYREYLDSLKTPTAKGQ